MMTIMVCITYSMFGQNFSEETNTPFVGVNGISAIQLGDVDGDGDLDIIGILGGTTAKLYKNNGAGIYTEETNGFITDTVQYLRFVDIEQDGDVDIFVIRNVSTSGIIWEFDLYENNGQGIFAKHITSGITNAFDNVSAKLQFAFGDVDGDGDMDMTLSGFTNQFSAKIWRYDGNYTFTESFSGILQVVDGKTQFTDIDNDGDQDLLVIGQTVNSAFYHKYFNNGSGSFSLGNVDSVEGSFFGDFDIADVDDDGDLDAVQVGANRSTTVITTHRNNGAGQFSLYFGVPASNYGALSTVKFADFNNDGDVDMIAASRSASPKMNIFLNTGTGNFVPMTGQSFASFNLSVEVQVGDIDNDGDIDIIQSYQTAGIGMYTTKIYKNSLATLSTEEFEAKNIFLYPNPTKNVITIQTPETIKNSIVYNILGEEMFQTNETSIHLSHLSKGLYMIQMEMQDGIIITRKIIKE